MFVDWFGRVGRGVGCFRFAGQCDFHHKAHHIDIPVFTIGLLKENGMDLESMTEGSFRQKGSQTEQNVGLVNFLSWTVSLPMHLFYL
ncbi:unnamed protein product [Calypogeia fissa]